MLRHSKEGWGAYKDANCYQFAIGVQEYQSKKLMPGVISRNEIPDGYIYSDDELIRLVKEDLSSLGYVLQKCEANYSTPYTAGEWEICILNCSKDDYEYDFHFLARFDGDWYQKISGDPRLDLIVSPETYKSDYNYHVVGYYQIKKAEE